MPARSKWTEMTEAKKSYHHGDLKQAFLTEAERVIETEGLQDLTLRGLSRTIGVSHTAPQNHFGDLTGLLSDLAADGHRRLVESLKSAAAQSSDPRERRLAMARAYVGFAREHPGLFRLMFRSERTDATRPALAEAIVASRRALIDVMATGQGTEAGKLDLALAARATAGWSLVHGYAMLLLENRLKGTLAALPIDEAEFFDSVLQSVRTV
jgi:AcrR family transcriptional regulator